MARRNNSEDPDVPPPPTRKTRVTRSQSREPQEVATAQRRPKQHGLPPVEEQVDNEDELQAHARAAEQQAAADTAQDDDDVDRSRHSVFSGTTAKTSFSQEEIAELDADVMLDVLPKLASAADDMAKFLLSANPQERPTRWKEIRTKGSKLSKLYAHRLAALGVHKHAFGSREYIQPDIVLRALYGVESVQQLPDTVYRPDCLLHKINLAEMLRAMVVMTGDLENAPEENFFDLENLEASFAFAIAGPVFDLPSVTFCVDLQVQLAIARLHVFRSDPNFDPIRIIDDTFLSQDDDDMPRYAAQLHMADASEKDQALRRAALTDALTELKRPFEQGMSVQQAVRFLRGQYPWHGFIRHLQDYYEYRITALDEEVANLGGFDQIMQDLSQAVERQQIARHADFLRQSLSKPSSTPLSVFGKGGIAALKEREKRLSGVSVNVTLPEPQASATVLTADAVTQRAESRQPAPVTVQTESQAPIDQQIEVEYPLLEVDNHKDWTQPHHSPTPGPSTRRPPPAVTSAELDGFYEFQRQRQRQTARPQARFLDRQPNAQRVQWDSQVSQHAAPPVPIESSAETHVVKDFNPTQDEGFQQDTRTVRTVQRKRARPSSSFDAMDDLPGTSTTPSPTKRRRRNPGSTIPDRQPLDIDASAIPPNSYQHAKVLAKVQRLAASINKPPQRRTPWSVHEENRLIALIENEGSQGISYAVLKRVDQESENVLHLRTAEDMRFKARNMKTNYLRARQPLPENWEWVNLDRKALSLLHDLGIEYHQDAVRSTQRSMEDNTNEDSGQVVDMG